MMVGLHGAGEAAAEESDGCRGVSRTAGSLLALGNSMTIIDTGLPGFASGQVSEGATVTPEAHSEVVDQILGRNGCRIGHSRFLACASDEGKPPGLGVRAHLGAGNR